MKPMKESKMKASECWCVRRLCRGSSCVACQPTYDEHGNEKDEGYCEALPAHQITYHHVEKPQ